MRVDLVRVARRTRPLSRVVGSAVLVFMLVMLVGESIASWFDDEPGGEVPSTTGDIVALAAVGVVMAGLALALWRPLAGGLVAVAGGVVSAAVVGMRAPEDLVVPVFWMVFVVPGALYVIDGLVRRRLARAGIPLPPAEPSREPAFDRGLRWVARSLAAAFTGALVLFGLGQLVTGTVPRIDGAGLLLVLTVAMLVAGLVLAWRHAFSGGLAILAASGAFALALQWGGWESPTVAINAVVPGVLFVLLALRERRTHRASRSRSTPAPHAP